MNNGQNAGLIKTQDLVGKPVISLQGEEVGTVARVIVDPVRATVAGLLVNVKGWFKGEKGLEFEAVNSFGDYAVTIQRAGQVVPLENLPTVEKLAKDYNIYDMRIITPQGKLVGTIDDFCFNKETGKIEKYILSGGLIKNLFKGRASIPAGSIDKIGTDVIIGVSDIESTIQKEESGLQDNIDLLKEDLEQWKDDFEKIWDKTRAKTLELSKTVGESLKEAAKSGKDKGKELLSKSTEIVTEKREQLKSSYEWWTERLQAIRNKPETPLAEDEIETLLGLPAGKTVTDDDGNIILEKDKEVSRETIEMAQKAGKTKELLISVASKDLEEKIKSVEEEDKKM